MMKRYDIDLGVWKEEDINGEWVKHSEVEQLQALTKEFAESIINNCMYEFRSFDYCIHCNGFGEDGINKHEEDCKVLKAQKYLDSLKG